MDHACGVAKSTIRREIAGGVFFDADVNEMVLILERKFGDRQNPKYVFKELLEKDMFEKQMDSRQTVFNTVDSSTKFQVIVFKPNSPKILTAERICLCELCKVAYGSFAISKEMLSC